MDYLSEIQAYNVRQALSSPGKTALLVIDMQRYFEGMARPILKNIMGLIDAAIYARSFFNDPISLKTS